MTQTRWRPWRSRRGALALAASLAAGLLVAGAVPALAAGPLPSQTVLEADVPFAVGLSPGADLINEPAAQVRSQISAMAAAGDRYIRIDVNWSRVEPSPGVYNWAAEDTAIGDAAGAGLIVDALMAYAPSWALTSGTPDPAAFSRFAQQVVRRYSPMGVNIYEVWNEPNLGYSWNDHVSAGSYGAFLKQAYLSIHAVDPGAVVLMGGLGEGPNLTNGLSVGPYTFLSELYADGFGPYFDAVNLHPYSFPDAPLTNDPVNNPVFPRLAQFYSLMVANGDALKKIWITEYGYPTANSPKAVTEQQQYDYLLEAMVALMSQPWAGPMFLFSWQDDPYQSFGLLHQNGTPKPALTLFEIAPHI